VDDQAAAAHRTAGFDPDIAIDDEFAAGHAVPHEVQSIAGVLDPDLPGVSGAHAKYISHGKVVPRGVDRRPLDVGDRLAGQQMRHQRRQIEALIGPMSERQHERFHGSKPFR
jgi:hypothetical protein